MRFGYIGGGIRRSMGATIYDPSTQAWDAWLRNYVSSPWNGLATTGTSSGKAPAEATNPPTSGTALGGYHPAVFNGTTQILTDTVTANNWVTAGAGSIGLLIDPGTISGGVSAAPDNPTIITNLNGDFGVYTGSATNNKFGVFINDGAIKKVEVALSNNVLSFVQARWDSTNLEARVNGGGWTSIGAGSMGAIGYNVRFGKNSFPFSGVVSTPAFWPGSLYECVTAKIKQPDSEWDYLRAYLNATYPGISV